MLVQVDSVHAAKSLYRLDVLELLVDDHSVQQRLIEARLVLFGHDEDVTVKAEFLLGLRFSNPLSVMPHVH